MCRDKWGWFISFYLQLGQLNRGPGYPLSRKLSYILSKLILAAAWKLKQGHCVHMSGEGGGVLFSLHVNVSILYLDFHTAQCLSSKKRCLNRIKWKLFCLWQPSFRSHRALFLSCSQTYPDPRGKRRHHFTMRLLSKLYY